MNIGERVMKSLTAALSAMVVALWITCPAHAQVSQPPKVGDQTSQPDGPAVRGSDQASHDVPAGEPSSRASDRAPDPVPAATPASNAETTGKSAAAPAVCQGRRNIKATVVAISQPFMLNRIGAAMPNAMVFALAGDLDKTGKSLRADKRARPIVLRANVGDCIQITFINRVEPTTLPPPSQAPFDKVPTTTQVGIHVQGMQLVQTINNDGSFVGVNDSSLQDNNGSSRTYVLYAEKEGTFLLYTTGDLSTTGQQLGQGLFGTVNVQPGTAEWYRSQVTQQDMELAIDHTKGNNGFTALGQPIINYDAKYPAGHPRAGTYILKMLDDKDEIIHSDLTAIITGPRHGRFNGTTGLDKEEPPCSLLNDPANKTPVDPLFCKNSASPDRKQPYREITIMYHEVVAQAVQAFPIFTQMNATTQAGIDGFAINYGTGGIGAEIYANRIGVGPMGSCVDCKFEEFFLSAWAVGDPAEVVDVPANATTAPLKPGEVPCTIPNLQAFQLDAGNNTACTTTPGTRTPAVGTPYTMTGLVKATKALYADDPSNVYHSYLNDHVKFRIMHAGTGITHVHHQHAHQWLQSPNSDEAAYLDSQMLSPGASYTLEMVYNGSGNRNKTVGDSIFHCHFYPHFAAGMWAMWRVHDVLEAGTVLAKNREGQPIDGLPAPGSRALPDGEIQAGTPIPAIVPVPTRPMPLPPSEVYISKGQVCYGAFVANACDRDGSGVKQNPGYPFFIPGEAGARAPHPPLDFAPELDKNGNPTGQDNDGGLPRHVINSGTIDKELHTQLDWSKDFHSLKALQLPEEGTHVEQVAMEYFSRRCRSSFFPDGTAANCSGPPVTAVGGFILNGLPRKNAAGTIPEKLGAQHGAPFADPAVNDDGSEAGSFVRKYRAAGIQLDVTFNRQGWHYPQERLLTLWNDVGPTIAKTRPAEPFFFRADSKSDIIEYWHTNLIPNYYDVDDFQVRTPTDIIGQHIHLVKFDVTSSDGAANGFNYEDGTFSPDEVQDVFAAVQAGVGGSWQHCPGCPTDLRNPQPPPLEICSVPNPPAQCTNGAWLGTQTTIQRWWADPLLNDPPKPSEKPVDRTLRTVFTHDHFGPSTHQQAGLYAGLVLEPEESTWKNSETGAVMGGPNLEVRPDGGPTSWKADIWTQNKLDSYREFVLEFQDFALAYTPYRQTGCNFIGKGTPVDPPGCRQPQLISTGIGSFFPGTQTVNYTNELLPRRNSGNCDMSRVFDSSCIPAPGQPPLGDPFTPILRAYEGDKVQVRTLVGAHMLAHFFTMQDIKWPFEPSFKDSGYRSSFGLGLSEHFELLFNAPPSSISQSSRKCPDGLSQGDCASYLYSPSYNDFGLTNGMWGLFRGYDPTKPFDTLKPLPSNPLGPTSKLNYQDCPANAPVRHYNVTAVTAQKALANQVNFPGQLVFNSRGVPSDKTQILRNLLAIMYVRTEDLDANGQLKPNAATEPLVLRASAGDCVEVTLTNGMDPGSNVFSFGYTLPQPFTSTGKRYPSKNAGLNPQLVSYDVMKSNGMNVGYNPPTQSVSFQNSITYRWYTGKAEWGADGNVKFTPIELGSLNLFPSDPLFQHINGLYGSMVVEPKGATWKCDSGGKMGNDTCDPAQAQPINAGFTRDSATVTKADKTSFREFVVQLSDDLRMSNNGTSAVNYRTEPTWYRYGNLDVSAFASDGDNDCAISNALLSTGGSIFNFDPQTPIFKAVAGTPFRFRLPHAPGTGTAQVFTLNGHVWARNPYINGSTEIGDNRASQWIGSRDSHGATDHFDLVVDKSKSYDGKEVPNGAGGLDQIPGDYLYTVFLAPTQTQFGQWGIFRVLDKKGNPVSGKPSCTPKTGPEHPVPVNQFDRFIRQPLTHESK